MDSLASGSSQSPRAEPEGVDEEEFREDYPTDDVDYPVEYEDDGEGDFWARSEVSEATILYRKRKCKLAWNICLCVTLCRYCHSQVLKK